MQTTVLVLSSPRSGSSCFTGCLHFCGMSIGKTPTTVQDRFNKKGYFENRRILNFNRAVLGDNNLTWKNPVVVTEFLNTRRTHLKQLFLEEFTDNVCVIKDPRIGILQNLYYDILKDKKVITIILHRNKQNTIKSMMAMPGGGIAKEFSEIYTNYYKLFDLFRAKYDTIDVKFENFLENPFPILENICNMVGISYVPRRVITSFIDKSLVHHK